jgi:hypothetical protein
VTSLSRLGLDEAADEARRRIGIDSGFSIRRFSGNG